MGMINLKKTEKVQNSVITKTTQPILLSSSTQNTFKKAKAEYKKGNYLQAQNKLNTVIAQKPEFGKAYFFKGLVFNKMAKIFLEKNKNNNNEKYLKLLSEAETNYKKAIELIPNNYQYFMKLAKINIAQNRNEEAIKNLKTAKNLNIHDEKIFFLLGQVYKNQQRDRKAINNFKKVADHGSGAFLSADRVFYELGSLYFAKKNYKKAKIYLSKAVELNSKHVPSFEKLGFTYLKLKDEKEARKNLERAINLDSSDPKAYINLGQILVKTSASEAIVAYKKAEKRDPKNYKIFELMGRAASTDQNKKIDALRYFLKSINLNPDIHNYSYEGLINVMSGISHNSPLYFELKSEEKDAISAHIFKTLESAKNLSGAKFYERIYEPGITALKTFSLDKKDQIITEKANRYLQLIPPKPGKWKKALKITTEYIIPALLGVAATVGATALGIYFGIPILTS